MSAAALARATRVHGHDPPSRGGLYHILGHFFGNAEQPFPPPHFGPDVVGVDARGQPQHIEGVVLVGGLGPHRHAVRDFAGSAERASITAL